MKMPQPPRPRSVAIVGTGMAGLTTAHLLHRDPESRYEVTLLEKQDKISLAAESIAIPSRDEKNQQVWADVPMRAFAGGFYHNLIRMYDYLEVAYNAQPFLFSFTRLPRHQEPPSIPSCIPSPQMVYASNFHQFPPAPRTADLVRWAVEAVYAIVCYCWFTICCFFIAPYEEDPKTGRLCESLDEYLRRMWMPRHYVTNYLVPLISSVCTCSHEELLCFPASDVLAYKRRTHRQQHFVVSGGVQSVQEKLLKGINVRLGAQITHVAPDKTGVQIKYSTPDGDTTEKFDLVILAVSPDIAAALYPSLSSQLSTIPTTTVETIAHTDESLITPMLRATSSDPASDKELAVGHVVHATQRIHLFSDGHITEAVHEQPNSILVTTNPIFPPEKSKVIRSAHFTRVLRSPRSRAVINAVFKDRKYDPALAKSASPFPWRNGDHGVFLAGGWCWDGMVLLEGCIVSAMRVANALGVEVPWDEEA
ncbi:hypothetical protein N7532_007553 [Penicillium argentinense]|uniref:Amine oxidase domain-containing protein n=1 Tax=Penicillium argentinense TaxID=1131581 RepID=A0A9W9F7X6_9EURO|nr:uncharacterized protein N7532_007553 [Penicillium argentinense]KAJ5095262.1 hypothetical protein N7532_007553 [Penicillium argentinense]